MPGTNQPQHGIQGLSAKLQEFARRLTSLETWQRTMSVGPSPWTAPTLINSWVPTGALPLAQPGYLKDPLGFVHLKGRVKGGTTGTAAFVLPAGFRPGGTDLYPMGQGSLVVSFASIDASGNVIIDSTSTADNALGGITFLAEN